MTPASGAGSGEQLQDDAIRGLSDPACGASPVLRPTRVRHVALGLLFLLAIITYLDRVCISVAAPWISREFQLTPVQMGLVFSVFAFAYALFEVPTGWMGDRFGARRTLTRIVVWWSAFTALTGFVNRLATLLIVRFLFGAGEAGAYPNINKALANWFPVRQRGMALGTIWMGSRLGGAIAPPLMLWMIHAMGWRLSFKVLGSLGIAWAVLWRAWYRDNPEEKRSVNRQELALIMEGRGKRRETASLPLKRLMATRRLWAIYLMYFTQGFVYYLYISWFPTYLMEARGVDLTKLAYYAVLPLLFSAASSLLGGLATDRLARRAGLKWGRRLVGIAGCSASAVFLLAGLLIGDTRIAIWFVALAAAASDFLLAACWSTCVDVGGTSAATISGAMNMVGNFGSMLSPLLMGIFVQTMGMWNLTFYVAVLLNLVGAGLWSGIDASRPIQD